MEAQYGIAVANKYELFMGDDDPLDILQQQELAKRRKEEDLKKGKPKSAKDVKAAKAKKAKAPQVNNTDQTAAKATDPVPNKRDGKSGIC